MRKKLTIIVLLNMLLLSTAPQTFAEEVVVAGKIENPNIDSAGSIIEFKDTISQKVVVTKDIDPLGNYVVYVPKGKYDISVIPPAQSGLQKITKKGQEISTATQKSFTLPSSKTALTKQDNENIKYILGSIIVIVFVVSGLLMMSKKKKK